MKFGVYKVFELIAENAEFWEVYYDFNAFTKSRIFLLVIIYPFYHFVFKVWQNSFKNQRNYNMFHRKLPQKLDIWLSFINPYFLGQLRRPQKSIKVFAVSASFEFEVIKLNSKLNYKYNIFCPIPPLYKRIIMHTGDISHIF